MSTVLGHATNSVKAFSVSLSPGNDLDPSHHKNFSLRGGAFLDVIKTSQAHAWSPIVWRGGERKKATFRSCALVAMDIDDGFSLKDAELWLTKLGFRAAILLSKSHQKQKGTRAPCDRFRILIDALEVRDLGQYEANMRQWLGQLPMADKNCKDGARFFFPSPKLFYYQGGRAFCWRDMTKQIEAEKIAQQKSLEKAREKVKSTGAISEGLRNFIMRGVPVGERHNACYWLGRTLAKLGLGFDDTVRLICAGPLAELGMDEINRTVRDARKAEGYG